MTKPIRVLLASFFALILAILIFNKTAHLEWLWIYHILAIILCFGGIGFAVYGYQTYGLDGRFGILLFTYFLCMVVLIGVVLQQMGPGFPDPGRVAKLMLIALLFLFFLGVSPNQRTFTKKTGVYLFAFGVLFSLYLYHSLMWAPATGRASVPITDGFMMGLCLFVIPRYVSRDMFMWILSIFASFFVLISIPVYYIGNYTFLGMEVKLYGSSFTPLFMNEQITVLQSVFENPNTFAVLAFSGTIAAAILAHRQYPGADLTHDNQQVRADGASATVWSYPFVRSLSLFCFAGMIFGINALGTYLSHSRASLLVVAFALALYFSYVSFGRRSLPFTLAALAGGFTLLLFLLPVIGINAASRFALWSGSVEAILNGPTLFGHGIVNLGETIAPYVEQPYKGHSPHNSYLNIFISVGVFGGIMYLVIVIGSLVSGAVRYQEVDIPSLVLAFGFALHQMFEAYSLFGPTMKSMIAALVFGYLILNGSLLDEDENEGPSHERDRRRRQQKSWSRPEWNR